MSIPERITRFLTKNKVYYQITVHPRTVRSLETAEREKVSGKSFAKVVMAKAVGKDVMLVLPAVCNVDLFKLTNELGTLDVKIEKEKDFAALFPDCETGAMPPVGKIYHIPCYVDKRLDETSELYFNAGSHTESITVPTKEFLKAIKAKLMDFAVPVKRESIQAA
jgi:Ala-tRNA(Pro) deacylase